ncbi:MAG: type II secretion system major pseudopilin GspG [Proteobacteria bacterium]|nr:type II secretion system major pseudopilin GspG [Pseudomonadota bacterium]
MQGGTRVETPATPRKRRQRRRRQAGFTLVELLVVLIILGLIAAFAAPRVIKFVGGAKTDSAKIQIERLSGVLDLYRLQVGRYPSEDEGLNALMEQPADAPDWEGPYLKKADALIDPWRRPYIYRFPGEHGDYDLYSLGADGEDGGEGEDRDLMSW